MRRKPRPKHDSHVLAWRAELDRRAQSCLALAYSRAQRWVRYTGGATDVEELFSEAMLPLARACAAFDPGRGTKLTTLVTVSVDRHLRDWITRRLLPRAHWRHCDLEPPIPDDEAEWVDFQPDPRAEEERVTRQAVAKVRRRLKPWPKLWTVLWGRFAEGRTQADIAGEIKVSKTRIQQLTAQGLVRARGGEWPTLEEVERKERKRERQRRYDRERQGKRKVRGRV